MKELTKPEISLGQKAIKGGAWVFTLRIADGVFQLVRTIILARLLVPNDFGLFGIALLVLSCLGTFSQTGFKQAFIQKKGDTYPYLNTTWTVQIIRGFLIALIVFFIAPYVAVFFKAPAAEPILRIIGLSTILEGLINPAAFYFEKELEFHKYFIYQFTGIIANVVVAISAAFILRSVWALIWGLLAGNLIRCIVSYIIKPYRPRLEWDFLKIKDFFGFGKWILGSSIVIFFANYGADTFLGKALGVTVLGFYQIAFRFANLPASQIGVLSRVAFPTYSKLQDNIPKLRATYLKMARFITFLAIPFAGGIFMLGPQFTKIFLGEKWMPMVPALRILAISAMIRTVVGTGGALFNARGRPDIDFKMNLARMITLAVTIYPLTILWKISGTSLSVLLATCACIPIWIIGSIKEAQVRIRDYLKILSPPLIGTAIMCAVIFTIGMHLNQFQLIGFLASGLVGIVTFLAFIFLIQNISDYTIFKDIKFMLNFIKIRR